MYKSETWTGENIVCATEERIKNLEELEKLDLKSYAFCVICQEITLPIENKPVFCNGCQTAVFCKGCIDNWTSRKRECPMCKRKAPLFLDCLANKEIAAVYDVM
jgi:hypothetical protein